MRYPTGPLFSLLAAVALLTVLATPAAAQTSTVSVTVNKTIINRTVPVRGGGTNPYSYWINRAECLADDVLSFKTTVTGAVLSGSKVLEVWAGSGSANCVQDTARGVASNTCWLVYRKTPSALTYTVDIRAQNIVAQNYPSKSGALATGGTTGSGGSGGTSGSGGASGSGGEASGGTGGTTGGGVGVVEADASVCESGASFESALTLYFMIVEGTQVVGTTDTWTKTGVDVDPPNAPTEVAAASGENRLLVSWKTQTVNDLLEWRFYCDPPPGTVADAGMNSSTNFGFSRQALEAGLDGSLGTGGSAAGTGGTVGTGGDPGVGGTASGGALGTGGDPGVGGNDAGGELDAGTGNATGTGGVVVSGTGGATTGNGCNSRSGALVPGKVPPESHRCGTTSGQTQRTGDAEGLINGQPYAVGVVGYDKSGNVGDLSALACGTPVLQTDFFELYKKWGGKGGGGLCSISRNDSLSPAIGLGALSLTFLGLMRRRKRND